MESDSSWVGGGGVDKGAPILKDSFGLNDIWSLFAQER